MWVLMLIFCAVVGMLFGIFIGERRGRPFLGAVLGLIFGPLGWIATYLLRPILPPEQSAGAPPSGSVQATPPVVPHDLSSPERLQALASARSLQLISEDEYQKLKGPQQMDLASKLKALESAKSLNLVSENEYEELRKKTLSEF